MPTGISLPEFSFSFPFSFPFRMLQLVLLRVFLSWILASQYDWRNADYLSAKTLPNDHVSYSLGPFSVLPVL